jgi:hypothetical protein
MKLSNKQKNVEKIKFFVDTVNTAYENNRIRIRIRIRIH